MGSQLYDIMNKKWKATAKAIFGEEAGELKDCEEWLSENNRPRVSRKSQVSGKDVSFVFPYYPRSSIISLDEADYSRKFEPLSINEIKDIDSIISALGERLCYAGNINLGNSQFVENSTDVMESFHVYSSTQISFSKYIAYGYNMEYCENIFGSMNIGLNCNYGIRLNNSSYITRGLETNNAWQSSDCYFSHNIENCKNVLFCFNLKSAGHAIGNLALPPDKFLQLKKKLLGEMANELRAEKRLPTMLELIGESEPDKRAMMAVIGGALITLKSQTGTLDPVEEAFQKTTSLLFGREAHGLDEHAGWLAEFIRKTKRCKSAYSGREMIVADFARYFDFPENRLVTKEEALPLGALRMNPDEVHELSLKSIPGNLREIAYFYPGTDSGEIPNIIDSQINISSANCYKSILNLRSKNSAYDFYILESESVFGCNSVRRSSFLVRCYLSSNLSRCFEVDSSRACSGAYYCQNCENVRDAMFCFSVKNRSHAIGNAELPPEKYLGIKTKLLEELALELEKGRGIKLNIFNLAERAKG